MLRYNQAHFLTRIHSNRMRTAAHYPHLVVSAGGDVHARGCACPGACVPDGRVCQGVCMPGGIRASWACVPGGRERGINALYFAIIASNECGYFLAYVFLPTNRLKKFLKHW